MASFDFKNALKTGIKQKQVKKGLLKEYALEDPQQESATKGGQIQKMAVFAGEQPWWKDADADFIDKWLKLNPAAGGYEPKTKLEKEMRLSPAAAAHVIMREIGAASWVSESDIEAVTLGILYYSKIGKIKDLEQAFKKEAGIKRRMWPYIRLLSNTEYSVDEGRTKQAIDDRLERRARQKSKYAWFNSGHQGPAEYIKELYGQFAGPTKCDAAASCVGAFILKYSSLSGDARRIRAAALTLLAQEDFNLETSWKISKEDIETGKTAEERAEEAAPAMIAAEQWAASGAGTEENLKLSVLQDAAELGQIKSVEFVPVKRAKESAGRAHLVKVTFDRGLKAYPWPGTEEQATAWFERLKPHAKAYSAGLCPAGTTPKNLPDGRRQCMDNKTRKTIFTISKKVARAATAKQALGMVTQSCKGDPNYRDCLVKAEKRLVQAKVIAPGVVTPGMLARAETGAEGEAGAVGLADRGIPTNEHPIAVSSRKSVLSGESHLNVVILSTKKSEFAKIGRIKKLSGNGRKHLFGGPEKAGSHMNLVASWIESKFGEPTLADKEKWSEDLWGNFRAKYNNANAEAMAELFARLGGQVYQEALKKSLKTAQTIKGGGLADIMKAMAGYSGADPSGAFERTRIPVEESALLEFEKTLQGLRHEDLYKRLMPRREIINEKEDIAALAGAAAQAIDWGDVKQSAASGGAATDLSQKQLTQIIAAYENARQGGAPEAESGMMTYLKFKLGDKITNRIFSSAAVEGAAATSPSFASLFFGELGAVISSAGATAAAVGTAEVGGLLAGTSGVAGLAGAFGIAGGVAVVSGGVLVAAAVGAAIGWVINLFLQPGTEEDRLDRLKMANKNPVLADAAMEVYCKGTGMLCGDNAPGGWQVDCKNEMGGYAMDAKGAGVFGIDFLGTHAGYTDPWGWKDLEQKAGSFSKQDIQDSLVFLSTLYNADQKAGKIKEVPIKRGEKGYTEGKVTVRLQLAEDSLLAKWEDCYKTNLNPYAGKVLTGKLRKAYETVQYAFGLPIIKLTKGEAAEKAAAAKAAGLQPEQVKKVQEALIEFFGESVAIKMGKEYGEGRYGPVSQSALEEFQSMFGSDPDYPTGKRAIKKLPDFIKDKILEKKLMDTAQAEPLENLEESKLSLHQKRLLEMNNRLMKF